MVKSFSLCADDFGLNSEVSQGILQLIEAHRLSATGCMVNLAGFKGYSKALLDLQSQVRIGLHFNLTEGPWLSSPATVTSLPAILAKTHLRLISTKSLRAEFAAQMQQFTDVMGRLPDFIDGHQHVHQFPVMRQIILDYYQSHLNDKGIELRSTFPAVTLPQYRFKATVLEWTGGRQFKAQLNQLEIPHNLSFSGVYDFNPQADYRGLFCRWLQAMPADTLIMCHPALAKAVGDEIADARIAEFEYLRSDAFIDDCERLGACLDLSLSI